MSDSSSDFGLPDRRLPAPVFFDPSFERVPAAAAYDPSRPGPTLLLFERGAGREWVADAAIALATAWNAAGRRTVLADLSLEDPVLHERIGMGDQDGVVDIFLYGASLARSARPVPGRGFYLIPAGTYTPEPEEIFRHPRWEKIVAGFREAQASLLLFAPTDAPALDALARWAQEVIVVGRREDEALFHIVLPPGLPVRAWLTPPVKDAPEPRAVPASANGPASARVERFPEPEPVHPAAAAAAMPRPAPPPPADVHPSPAGPGTPPPPIVVEHTPASQLPVPDPSGEEAVPERGGLFGGKRRAAAIPKKRRVSPILLVLLVLVLVFAAAYAALALFAPDTLEGLIPTAATSERAAPAPRAPAREAAAPRRAPAPAAPAGTPQPYAVFVRAFPDPEAARRYLAQVRGQVPGVAFFVIPEDTQGQLYHKVYAGMLQDTVEAAALRARLVEGGQVNPDDAGGPSALIQERPLAFDLGDFRTRPEAEARADSLAVRAIPAYAVAVPLSDGGEAWKLYGGAFPDSASAAPMQKMLTSAGLPARLVRRQGRPSAPSK